MRSYRVLERFLITHLPSFLSIFNHLSRSILLKFIDFFRRSMLGLDIQEHGIYLLELNKKRSSYVVKRMLAQSLPAGIYVDGKIAGWNELKFFLQDLARKNKLSKQIIATSLPAELVRIQKLQLTTHLKPAETRTMLVTQLQRDLPSLKDNLCLDYYELPSSDQQQQALLVAATRQEYINQLNQCFQAAELRLKIIEVDIYAWQRLFAAGIVSPAKTNGIFLWLQDFALLIIFTNLEIIFHQRWIVFDKQKIWHELEDKLRIYHSIYPQEQITQLIYFSTNELPIKNGAFANIEQCQFYNPCESDLFAAKLDPAFMLAAGCAMREVPPW